MKYNKDGIKYRLCAMSNKGITLIALIVTIVVLLILAGITIASITGNNAPIDKAGQAKNETEIKAEMEELQQVISKASSKSFIHGNFSGNADINEIKTALNNSGLINGTAEEEIINGQNEIIFTGKKTNTQYSVESTGNIVRLYDTGTIEVGDTVNYCPSGTYNWNAEYATSYASSSEDYTNANITLKSGTKQNGDLEDFGLNTWKVLNINKKTGNVELVPSQPTTGTVRLYGAQGYNNGVKLLNDACNSLYGNSNKGINARSIRIEDIDDAIKQVNPSALPDIATNPIQISELTKANSWYPTIYKLEKNSVIDGVDNNNSSALKKSEQNSLISRTDENASIGKLQASSSIQPYRNYYYKGNTNLNLASSLGIYKNILLPNNTPTYWIASRFITTSSNGVIYSINYVHNGGFDLYNFLYYSGNLETGMKFSLFPVITINYNQLEKTTSSGTWNVK